MQRIALEIAEDFYEETGDLIIVGIAGSGMVIAKKLHDLLQPLLTINIELITCELNKRQPETIAYSADFEFNNKNVLVADDVTNSGKTLLYALKPLLQFHPKTIRTMSLVERMHKSFPIKIDYIGLSVATTLHSHIAVEVEGNEIIGAFMM